MPLDFVNILLDCVINGFNGGQFSIQCVIKKTKARDGRGNLFSLPVGIQIIDDYIDL